MSTYAGTAAHASANSIYEALPGAVSSGVTASAQSLTELAEAAKLREQAVTNATLASSLTFEQAFQVASALDNAGYTAFYNDMVAALEAAAPEGWTPPV